MKVEVWDRDRFSSDDFMGQVTINLAELASKEGGLASPGIEQWYRLEAKGGDKAKKPVTGQLKIKIVVETAEKTVDKDDFEVLKLIGSGSFAKVYLVKKKDTEKIYAMKVLKKKMIIDQNELEHTKAELAILMKNTHPFVMNLKFSFQGETKLYLILDCAYIFFF